MLISGEINARSNKSHDLLNLETEAHRQELEIFKSQSVQHPLSVLIDQKRSSCCKQQGHYTPKDPNHFSSKPSLGFISN